MGFESLTGSMGDRFNVAERLFGKDNPYFDSFYLDFDCESLRSFFKIHDDKRRFLTHLYFYTESLVCVRNTPDTVADPKIVGGLAPLHSGKLWYANLLMILIGIIDQTVLSENIEKCTVCGRPNKTQTLVRSVMSKLPLDIQKRFIDHYKEGSFKQKGFTKIVDDIYRDRNYFAHQISEFNPPSKSGLTFDVKEEGIFISPNLKHEEILLTIILALIKYWGYEEKLEVCTSKKYGSLLDFM